MAIFIIGKIVSDEELEHCKNVYSENQQSCKSAAFTI
jgi:hypothetical protein